jgi:hypothetical protein
MHGLKKNLIQRNFKFPQSQALVALDYNPSYEGG